MIWFALCAGWLVAAVLAVVALRLLHRLELVAQAQHELRGPATAIGLAVASLRREPGGLRRARALEAQLERMRAGLADLEAARAGRRAGAQPSTLALDRVLHAIALGWRPLTRAQGRELRLSWEGEPAAVRADPGRLAQALGNLVANAVEHGSGQVELRGRRRGGRAIVEVRDEGPSDSDTARPASARSGRGRGLAIAARAAQEAGGRVTLECDGHGTTAAVELPLRE